MEQQIFQIELLKQFSIDGAMCWRFQSLHAKLVKISQVDFCAGQLQLFTLIYALFV